jgi:competence protein ComEC
LGILIASRYTQFYQAINTPYCLFYNISIITATISLLSGLFFKSPGVRFCCFFFSGALLYLLYNSDKEALFINFKANGEKELEIYGKVCSPSLPYPDNIRFMFSIDSTSRGADFLRKKTVLCLGKERIAQGASLRITGKIKIPGRRANHYEFDEFSYLLSNGIATKFTIDSLTLRNEPISFLNKSANRFRSGVALVINNFSDPDQRAIFYAAFLGETEYLSSNLKLSFRNSGIYHLLSISVLHAAMLIAACYFLIGLLPIPLRYRHCIALLTIWLYQCFIGFIPCLFRATLMATLIIVTFLFQKKSYPVQAIGLAGTIWLLISPESLFQPGYQLSFAATFGILTIYPVLNRFLPVNPNRFINYFLTNLFSSFYLSITGLICTLPIILYYFGSVSIYGLFENLVAVPVMTFAMWSFFMAIVCTVFFPLLAPLPVFLCKFLLTILIVTANFSFAIPWSSVQAHAMSTGVLIIFSIAMVTIAIIKKKYQKTTLLLVLPILLCSVATDILVQRLNASVAITKFNTGEDSMYAINWRNKKVWLIISERKKRTTDQCLKIAQNWILHQGNSSIEVILFLAKNKNTPAEIPVWQNLFTKTTVPLDDSLLFIHTSSSILEKSSDTCVITNRNDTLWVKVARSDIKIRFPMTGIDTRISLQNYGIDCVKHITSPCVITLKKDGFGIHIYKFPGK